MVDLNDGLQRALAELREPEERPSPAVVIPAEVHARAVEILTASLVRDGRALGQHSPAEYETAVMEAQEQIAEEPREALRRIARKPDPTPVEALFARAHTVARRAGPRTHLGPRRPALGNEARLCRGLLAEACESTPTGSSQTTPRSAVAGTPTASTFPLSESPAIRGFSRPRPGGDGPPGEGGVVLLTRRMIVTLLTAGIRRSWLRRHDRLPSDWSLQTDARAKPVRPKSGSASGVPSTGRFG